MATLQQAKYIRDGRAPIPQSENISRVMSANKDKDTKPELLLRKMLWVNGLRGYRLHWKKAPGRPDIAYTSKKLAIFINGCFWHRCPHCNLSLPKSNTDFWQDKFKKNVERDKRKIFDLEDGGWTALTFWECEVKKDPEKIVQKIEKELKKR